MQTRMLATTLLLAAGLTGTPGQAVAADGATVECVSHYYQYNECYAPLKAP